MKQKQTLESYLRAGGQIQKIETGVHILPAEPEPVRKMQRKTAVRSANSARARKAHQAAEAQKK